MNHSPAVPEPDASAPEARRVRRSCRGSGSFRLAALAVAMSLAMHSVAEARDPSSASAAVSEGSAASVVATGSVVVGGSALALAALGTAVVTSVEVAGDVGIVVLRGLSTAGGVTLRLVGGASLVVGSVVEVVVVGTGCALMSAGRMIAFVPNEIGRSLVRQRPLATVR